MSFDLDIIHSTFSVNELSNTGSDMFRMADFEYGLPIDPLFGWINVSTPLLEEDTPVLSNTHPLHQT